MPKIKMVPVKTTYLGRESDRYGRTDIDTVGEASILSDMNFE